MLQQVLFKRKPVQFLPPAEIEDDDAEVCRAWSASLMALLPTLDEERRADFGGEFRSGIFLKREKYLLLTRTT